MRKNKMEERKMKKEKFFNNFEKLIILGLLESKEIDDNFIADLQDIYSKLSFSFIAENCNKLDFMIMRKIFDDKTYELIQNTTIKILKEKLKELENQKA